MMLMTETVPAALRASLLHDYAELTAALGEAGPPLFALAEQQSQNFPQQLATVLSGSQFVAQALTRHTGLFESLVRSGDLWRSYGPEETAHALQAMLEADLDEARMMTRLRQFRRREMVRIVWRDFSRLAETMETTRDLSHLAEACTGAALAFAEQALVLRHGEPIGRHSGERQRLVVLGMGKLGAWELNLSSDVDLIFAYPEAGETNGERVLSNHEYFIRLGQRMIKLLDATTADGFVFRVDMRLRPYGDSGALALNFDAMEEYYQDQGREWERYAMVKARVIAGDRRFGEQLMQMLRPFTYRRYIDFSAIDSLRSMKSMINREVLRRGLQDDVKLGRGGIREIEFIVQSFQLIRGGKFVELQDPRLLKVLNLLVDDGLFMATDADELRAAYLFLRNTEHAIQGYADQQTQSLPTDQDRMLRVAMLMGYASIDAFRTALDAHRARVMDHFSKVVVGPSHHEGAQSDRANDCWPVVVGIDELSKLLADHGFDEPDASAKLLSDLAGSSKLALLAEVPRERLDRLIPMLLDAAVESERPSLAIERVIPLLEAVLRRSAYLVLLRENPQALKQLVRLLTASPMIARNLTAHPVLLDELIDQRVLVELPTVDQLRSDLRQMILRIPPDDLEQQMDTLRYFKLANGLRCAASEVSAALPLMKVSDYLTWTAETILDHALRVAWQYLTTRHGYPCDRAGERLDPGFLIVAYGKMGGIELGHNSDLDLVFLHAADPMRDTDGDRPINNAVFYNRLGQRIIHILSTFTSMGQLYEVDMRLRPSGESGALVPSINAFRDYEATQAWTWEHQALVRARVVAGCPTLAADFEQIRADILALPRDLVALRQEVREMRQKMQQHLLKPETSGGKSALFHLKQSAGGIVDIEFMVQYWVLAWSGQTPSLSRYTDNIRILEALEAADLISSNHAAQLTEAYKTYRTATHRIALQQAENIVPAEPFQHLRDAVIDIWNGSMVD